MAGYRRARWVPDGREFFRKVFVMIVRRYEVWFEDIVTGADWFVGRSFTARGMQRRIRRANGLVSGDPVRFFGKDRKRVW